MRFRDLKRNNKQPSKPFKQVIAYASFISRAKAFMTDIFMIGLPVALVIMVVFGYQETKTAGALDLIVQDEKALEHRPNPAASITQIMLIMGVHVMMWRRGGQTPGKKFAHIKVVDNKTQENASYIQLSIRFIGYFISFLLIFGFLVGLFRKDKRTLHDILSATAVIYTDN